MKGLYPHLNYFFQLGFTWVREFFYQWKDKSLCVEWTKQRDQNLAWSSSQVYVHFSQSITTCQHKTLVENNTVSDGPFCSSICDVLVCSRKAWR
ncbi:hypothetical protein VIGAN_UM067300 [Vigna angularis var. angularis]|uniref:Uncharacterized protein n=1 Tax=Vigna angularis var. angularis TaxID=157739 RepID=A0A0S3TDS8_PHAAN|nr:hypothetical protein VIGAN_UM067300 [Vigna angularis var. angularis]